MLDLGAETRHVAPAQGAGKAGLPYRSSGSETGSLYIPRSTGLDQGRMDVVGGQLCRGSPSEPTPKWLWAFWQAMTFSPSCDPFPQTLCDPNTAAASLTPSFNQKRWPVQSEQSPPQGEGLEGSPVPTFPPHGF